MQRARDRHQREDPRQAGFADECEVSLTSVSEIEASTSIGRPTHSRYRRRRPCVAMRVWIDLTNSPHVLVMRPVIERLRADGHEVRVTARDFAQTLELCERLGIEHTAIGRHRGERLRRRPRGLASRSAALVRWARAERAQPDGASTSRSATARTT